MLVLAFFTLFLHNCTFLSASIAVKQIMCIKRVLGAKYRVLAQLTSFLLNNAFKPKEKLVLVLVSLTMHILMRLHASQCFHCVETDNVH